MFAFPRSRDRALLRRLIGATLLATITIAGCQPTDFARRPKTLPPTNRIIFQPHFTWADGRESQQGTGFIARFPDGKVLGVTSAHFLDFDGPPLVEARWLDVVRDREVVKYAKSHGKPGREGTYDPVDMRSDYLLVIPGTVPPTESILPMDERNEPAVGERVWLPDKNPKFSAGYHVVEGVVTDVAYEYVEVVMYEPVKPQSQSGSPFISQLTGRVIGTWAGGRRKGETIHIYLTPARAIVNAEARANRDYPLAEVVGKHSEQSAVPTSN